MEDLETILTTKKETCIGSEQKFVENRRHHCGTCEICGVNGIEEK